MNVLDWARKVQAIAHCGLAFTHDHFDRKRYEELQELVAELLTAELAVPIGEARKLFVHEPGYATPKVDVRGAVFKENKVLLVRELSDGRWSLPGGWADVNDTPSSAIEREIREESGYEAKAVKLAAVYDRRLHSHPPYLHHAYKLFFICDLTGGAAQTSNETDGVDFFALDALPELSTGRVTRGQIERLFEHDRRRDLPTEFD